MSRRTRSSRSASNGRARKRVTPSDIVRLQRGDVVFRGDPLGALKPTAAAQIVKVGGITGIFTPVTNKADVPITDDERKNFQVLIDDLSKQVAELQASNQTLSQQLSDLRNPPRSTEAFTTAIQHSVDDLQQKLTTMMNPVSNFGLKDFRIDAKVMIDVSRLGTVEYRFIRPGDPIDPNALSHITMDLVPIPKSGVDHTWTSDLFQPDLGIEALPEINGAQTKTLEANDVFTIGDFLKVGTRARAVVELVALLGIERTALSAWLRQAELLTLKGTNGATVLVLIAAGFASLEAIAVSVPDALLSAYLTMRKKMRLPAALEPTLADVTRWSNSARRYVGAKPAPAPDPPILK